MRNLRHFFGCLTFPFFPLKWANDGIHCNRNQADYSCHPLERSELHFKSAGRMSVWCSKEGAAHSTVFNKTQSLWKLTTFDFILEYTMTEFSTLAENGGIIKATLTNDCSVALSTEAFSRKLIFQVSMAWNRQLQLQGFVNLWPGKFYHPYLYETDKQRATRSQR